MAPARPYLVAGRLCLFATCLACGGQTRDKPSDGAAPRAPTTLCRDSVETRALECSGQSARRSGDTLFVRLDSGRDTAFVDVTDGEAPSGFHYAGRLGRASFHLVEAYGGETPPSWIVLNPRTGRTVRAEDPLVVSPDTLRFATAAEDWNNCVERNQPSLDVWRLTDTLPVLEWRLDPFDCRRQTGWGPTHPRWRGPDTLEFVRNDLVVLDSVSASGERVQYVKRPMVAARDGAGWRIVGAP